MMMTIQSPNSPYPSYANPYAMQQQASLPPRQESTVERPPGRTRDAGSNTLPPPPPTPNPNRTRDAENAGTPKGEAKPLAVPAIPGESSETAKTSPPATQAPDSTNSASTPLPSLPGVAAPGQANTGQAGSVPTISPPGQANTPASPGNTTGLPATANPALAPVPVVNPYAYAPWVNPAFQQTSGTATGQPGTVPQQQRNGANTPQAPQQPQGSGLATLNLATQNEDGTPVSSSKQNKQLTEAILQAAQQVGAPQEDLDKIKYRLSKGNFEVANADVSQALNITQAAQTDIETRNRLIEAAYNEIQSSLTREEAQQKLTGLAARGEVADFVADEADQYGNISGNGTFISYNTDQTPVKGQPGISRYTVAQRQTRFNEAGEAVQQLKPIDVKQVDALGEWVYVNPTRFRGIPALSGDAKLQEDLNTTLQTPEFATAFNRAVEEADTASAAPTMVSASLQPMLDQIATTYGIQPVGIQLNSGSPDGGLSNAWYDQKNRIIQLSTDTLQQLNQHGTNKGLSGEKLNRFVITELVATLAHEAKHARDYDAIGNPEAFGIKSDSDKEALQAIATNRQYYNGPATTRILTGEQALYEAQPVERSVAPFEQQALDTLYTLNGLDQAKLRQ